MNKIDDTISRQAAIAEVEKSRAYVGHRYNIESMVGRDIFEMLDNVGLGISKLPPAQPAPDQNGDLWITVQDIDEVTRIYVQESKSKFCRIYYEEQEQPEPFTSKWIPIGMADAVGGESAMWGDKIAYHVCEKCWKQALERDGEEVLSDFCPNCGADMREVTT